MRRTLVAAAVAAAALSTGTAPPASAASTLPRITVSTDYASAEVDAGTGAASVTPAPVTVVETLRDVFDSEPPPRDEIPTLGYIEITGVSETTEPTWLLTGALADPTMWTCSDNDGYGAVPFTVTCRPTGGLVAHGWGCDVQHVSAQTTGAGSRARTTMDCNGGGSDEARTRVVSGNDSDWVLSGIKIMLTELVCTVDDGKAGPRGVFTAVCGDPPSGA